MTLGNERLGPKQRNFGTGVLVVVAIVAMVGGMMIASGVGLRSVSKNVDLTGGKN